MVPQPNGLELRFVLTRSFSSISWRPKVFQKLDWPVRFASEEFPKVQLNEAWMQEKKSEESNMKRKAKKWNSRIQPLYSTSTENRNSHFSTYFIWPCTAIEMTSVGLWDDQGSPKSAWWVCGFITTATTQTVGQSWLFWTKIFCFARPGIEPTSQSSTLHAAKRSKFWKWWKVHQSGKERPKFLVGPPLPRHFVVQWALFFRL